MTKVHDAAPPRMGGREWAMLLALAILWGGSFFFNGVAVRELPSVTLVWLRLGVAAMALLLVLRLLGQALPRERRIWAAFLGMGLLNNAIPFVLIVWGQHRIASGLAAILNATTPLFGVLVAHALTPDEKLTLPKVAGVVLGLFGVAVMIGPGVLEGLGHDLPAQLACLGAALSYAFAGIYGRRFRRMGVAPLTTAAGQVCASALLLLPVMLLVDQPWTLPPPGTASWAAVLGVGLLSTALAYWLYFRILATAGATNLLLVTFLIPATAILLGALVLDEKLHAQHLMGMALIGGGLAFIDGRLPRHLRRPRPAKVG
ncbi:DMT family transporter [Roseomonas chloroacetimidivorans]|uniref:DMT family transporter n=1 Tax=Roseomonas chloroacetimidivorans TaxID=1766656 RepID=UPI003C76782B